MPPLVTSLPWLSNQPDPVQTYQRSQALVQQMQAQQAQERQAQAALAQRAQEAAMQAQFQQRALALKEQEAKSAVQVEADRLRQKGQALEFEQRQAAMENELLNRPPEVVELPGLPPAIRYRGRLAFPPGTGEPPDRLGQMVPVPADPNDPNAGVGGYVVRTGPRQGTYQPNKPNLEEKAAAISAKEATKFQRDRLLSKEKQLQKIQPGTPGYDSLPDEAAQLAAVRQYQAVQKELDAFGKPSESVTPVTANGVRIRRKSDGKILRYQGNKADVPTAEFEILE